MTKDELNLALAEAFEPFLSLPDPEFNDDGRPSPLKAWGTILCDHVPFKEKGYKQWRVRDFTTQLDLTVMMLERLSRKHATVEIDFFPEAQMFMARIPGQAVEDNSMQYALAELTAKVLGIWK